MTAKATQVDPALDEEASGILSRAAVGPEKRHGELPESMPSQGAQLLDHRRLVLSDVGIVSTWGESLS